MLKLADCLQERLAFDVTDSSSDLYNCKFCIFRSRISVKTRFDFVCNMWDYLDSSAAEITAAFLLENRPVYLSCCDIGIFVKAFVNKPFIVSKIKIRFGAVICYKYFTVLDRIHKCICVPPKHLLIIYLSH